MNTLIVQTENFKKEKFPSFHKEVLHLKTKNEADEFFKNHQYPCFTFIKSEVKKNGNYILEYKSDINLIDKEKQFHIVNNSKCLQGGSNGKNIILEFTKETNGEGKTL